MEEERPLVLTLQMEPFAPKRLPTRAGLRGISDWRRWGSSLGEREQYGLRSVRAELRFLVFAIPSETSGKLPSISEPYL